jgi:Flp pilus assembly protein TadG
MRPPDPARRPGQSGQTLVMFALVLMLVLVVLLALVVDLAAVVTAYDRAALAATVGAQAGATAVDTDTYYRTGRRQLLPGQAQALCRTAVNLPAQPTCAVSGDTVTVTVTQTVALPLTLLGASVPISVTRRATGVFGGRTPEPTAGGGGGG